MSTLKNVKRSRIFGFSTSIEISDNTRFKTDGKIDTTSISFMKPSAKSHGKFIYPITGCTYVVYMDEHTGEIFIEAVDGVDESLISKAIMELEEKYRR